MYGTSIGTLNVYVTASGQTNNRPSPAFTLSGDQGNQWKKANVTMSPTGNYQIVFEGIRGSSFQGDIAFDDILVRAGDCADTDCGLPPLIRNGQLANYSSTTYPSKIKLECRTGYEHSHQDFIQCQRNGTWSMAVCTLVDCGSPPQIGNGQLANYSSTTYPSTIELECRTGYGHGHQDFIQCQSNGTWSMAECTLVDCGHWPRLANFSRNQMITYLNSTFVGATALMTCDTGYHVFNDSNSHTELAVCLSNGSWSPPIYSQCIPIDCGEWRCYSSALSYQKIIYTNATIIGSEAVMTCTQGYHVVNKTNARTESAVCTENGTWSTQTCLECVPTDCGEWSRNSSVLQNQKIIYTNTTIFGSEAVMTCNPGYHVVNTSSTLSESAVCTENGTWSTQTYSECVPTDCGRMSTPVNGYVVATTTTVESTATITCHTGYVLNGGRTSTCGITGEWSSTGQTCSPVDCGLFDPPKNSHLSAGSSTYNSTVIITCFPGYILSGKSTSTCGAHGQWSDADQKCVLQTVFLTVPEASCTFANNDTCICYDNSPVQTMEGNATLNVRF
ncbi:sushi, von Willebrand factor type A, EGF and pentraxin domain-containing protein 1-like isoform X2 [Dreissena polymorpha]|nr:sushi, von Willebrand factor type A, EGF and pentraxin domain-containing protein 1-like isoform X2 [Dreissena polymorpha]